MNERSAIVPLSYDVPLFARHDLNRPFGASGGETPQCLPAKSCGLRASRPRRTWTGPSSSHYRLRRFMMRNSPSIGIIETAFRFIRVTPPRRRRMPRSHAPGQHGSSDARLHAGPAVLSAKSLRRHVRARHRTAVSGIGTPPRKPAHDAPPHGGRSVRACPL